MDFILKLIFTGILVWVLVLFKPFFNVFFEALGATEGTPLGYFAEVWPYALGIAVVIYLIKGKEVK